MFTFKLIINTKIRIVGISSHFTFTLQFNILVEGFFIVSVDYNISRVQILILMRKSNVK